MAAAPGELLVAYPYTSCPDICPTTLADLRTAFEQVGPATDAVDVAMVTVDPERTPARSSATTWASFFDRYHAPGEFDLDRLAEIEAPLRASSRWSTRTTAGSRSVTPRSPYVIDDTGQVLVEWPFGTEPDAMAADLEVLLERQRA